VVVAQFALALEHDSRGLVQGPLCFYMSFTKKEMSSSLSSSIAKLRAYRNSVRGRLTDQFGFVEHIAKQPTQPTQDFQSILPSQLTQRLNRMGLRAGETQYMLNAWQAAGPNWLPEMMRTVLGVDLDMNTGRMTRGGNPIANRDLETLMMQNGIDPTQMWDLLPSPVQLSDEFAAGPRQAAPRPRLAMPPPRPAPAIPPRARQALPDEFSIIDDSDEEKFEDLYEDEEPDAEALLLRQGFRPVQTGRGVRFRGPGSSAFVSRQTIQERLHRAHPDRPEFMSPSALRDAFVVSSPATPPAPDSSAPPASPDSLEEFKTPAKTSSSSSASSRSSRRQISVQKPTPSRNFFSSGLQMLNSSHRAMRNILKTAGVSDASQMKITFLDDGKMRLRGGSFTRGRSLKGFLPRGVSEEDLARHLSSEGFEIIGSPERVKRLTSQTDDEGEPETVVEEEEDDGDDMQLATPPPNTGPKQSIDFSSPEEKMD
jgi:hypothetical protein